MVEEMTQKTLDDLPLVLSPSFTEHELNEFLRVAVSLGSSDITIQSGDYVWGNKAASYQTYQSQA